MDIVRIHDGLYLHCKPFASRTAVPMLRVEACLDGEDRPAGVFDCQRNEAAAETALLAFFKEELAQTAYALSHIRNRRVPWENGVLYGAWSRFARVANKRILRIVQNETGRNTMELRGPRNRILTRQLLLPGTGRLDARLAEKAAETYLTNALKQYKAAIDAAERTT